MSNQRMIVTGGSGYLGGWVADLARSEWEVAATYTRRPGELIDVDWRALDVRDAAAVHELIASLRPAVIVHTAALNPGQGNDFATVNVAGTANIASASAAVGARLIHISTDMVFDGQRGGYHEDDQLRPLTEYGRTKAAAEIAVIDSGVDAVIVRTSLIYGWEPTIARSAQWMIDAINRGETVRLWSDEMRCPIWVESLAAAVVELAKSEYTGPLHVTGAEALSRYEFGMALLSFHDVDGTNVLPAASPPDEPRPRDCTLDSSRARAILTTPLPGVTEVLANN